MRLVMFDVDGTLVDNDGVDSACYCQALKEALGIGGIDTDWSHYSKVTDLGITSEIIETKLSRPAQQRDIEAVRQSYLARLGKGIRRNRRSLLSVPGASALIAHLRSLEDVRVCVATGGWRDAALLKLETVGIAVGDMPFASSDDSDERHLIMLAAYRRALAREGRPAFDAVLYVGDHVGDLANAEKLGYGFVGIGAGEYAQELRDAGAKYVMPDLLDIDYFLGALRSTPRTGSPLGS